MIEISVTIPNLPKIQSAFRAAPARMTQELSVAIERVISRIEGTAKRKAPVNKRTGGGTLRQSIRSRMTGIGRGVVEVTASYAAYVHEGTRPHIIRVVRKKVLADRRMGRIYGKVVNHPGTRPQPFLQEAVDAEQDFVNREMIKAVDRVFK